MVWCVVLVLVFGGGGFVCCEGVVWWCGVFFVFFSLFSLSSLLSLSCSRSFFLFSSFLLLSSLLAMAANFEAFECDLAHGKCTAIGSLPPLLKKKGGNFSLQKYIWRGNYLKLQF